MLSSTKAGTLVVLLTKAGAHYEIARMLSSIKAGACYVILGIC
jgi:hypothetical protein